MKLQPGFEERFADIDALIAAGRYDAADRQLEEIHIDHHDEPFVHLRVHVLQLRIARRQRNIRRAAGQILPIVFAVPVSYVQRQWGLALPSRMKSRDCQ